MSEPTFHTIRMTVSCPYCGTAYTFRSEEKLAAWRASDKTAPLHKVCVKEQVARIHAKQRGGV